MLCHSVNICNNGQCYIDRQINVSAHLTNFTKYAFAMRIPDYYIINSLYIHSLLNVELYVFA